MTLRLLPRRDYMGLRAATRLLVDKVGGANAAAAITRPPASTISKYYGEPDEMYAAIDVVADLEAHLNDPIVTRHLAEMSGHALVPLHEAVPAKDSLTSFGEFCKEAGETIAAYGAATADGKLDDKEMAGLLAHISEMATTLACLQSTIEQQLDNVTLFRAQAR